MASKSNDSEMMFVFSMIHHLNNSGDRCRVDWDAVAAEFNIGYARNAAAKFNAIAKTYGYKWERNNLIRLDGFNTGGGGSGIGVGSGGNIPKTPTKKRAKTIDTATNAQANEGGKAGISYAKSKKQKIVYDETTNVAVKEEEEGLDDDLNDSDQA